MDSPETGPQAPPGAGSEYLKALGARLADARKHSGLTQGDAGDYVQVPKQTISRWERGLSDPAYSQMDKLADLYGVSLDWLSGKALHKTGLRPGYTIVNVRALARLRKAVEDGETLADVMDDLVRGPGADIAFDVPEELMLLDLRAAKALHHEIQNAIEKLQRRTP